MRRQIKEAGLACLTFSGVASLYIMPIAMLLASPRQRVVATAIYDTPPVRQVVFDLSPLDPISDDRTLTSDVVRRSSEIEPVIESEIENINLPSFEIVSENINLEAPSSAPLSTTPEKSKTVSYTHLRAHET